MSSTFFRSRKGFGACMRAVLVSLSLIVSAAFTAAAEWEWQGVSRVVALGDVHGSFEKLTACLRAAGLADDSFRWSGGKDHLVLCGDLVDRGRDDRKVLDLVRKLQEEAARAGGRVHVLAGNHEALNLVRDLRYVHPQSYASFASDEDSGMRRRAWEGFRKAMSKPEITEAALRAAFEKRCPEGYFGRLKAFGKGGRYGSWLLKLPAAVKINGVVFVHGGLTPETAAPGLDAVNRRVDGNLGAIVESIEALDQVLGFPGAYAENLALAQALETRANQAGGSLPPQVHAVAENFLAQAAGPVLAPDGPLWYRGNSVENERIEREPLSSVLRRLNARALVVGHTITRSGKITSRFSSRLYRTDVGMAYGGAPSALVFDGSGAKVLDPSNGNLSLATAEPPPGEGWALSFEHLPDARLEKFLAEAEVASSTELSRGRQRAKGLELRSGKLRMRGVFKDIDEGQPRAGSAVGRYQHELAAYWLDRRLGLGMVPPVVFRNIGGKAGSLRAAVETAVDAVSIRSYTGLEQVERDEMLRRLAVLYALDLKELMSQAAKVRMFDSLIGNPGRQDEDRLWIPRDHKVALVDHERAFTTGTEVDPVPLCEYLDPGLRLAIQSLRLEELRAALSAYLSEEQMRGVLARRDRVLERCADTAGYE